MQRAKSEESWHQLLKKERKLAIQVAHLLYV